MTVQIGDAVAASLRSVGTAMTLTLAGALIAYVNMISPLQKKGMAKVAMNITIPALLFTSILDCTQNWSSEPCADIRSYIQSGWPLLFLPVVNVSVGLVLGYLVGIIAHVPENFRYAVMAAVAFGNTADMCICLCKCHHTFLSA